MKSVLWIALAAFALTGFVAGAAQADVKDYYARRALEFHALAKNPALFEATLAQSDDQWFEQKLDHTAPNDTRTFKQRYWVNSIYAKGPDSPVLLYICGEATCSSMDMGGATMENAQKLGAYAVALEHRYYGKSQPFDSLTTYNLKYLTINNALADLANFEQFAKAKLGLSGKWISIGGSYPGALSAYYRALYPDMIDGSLASSAPVQARDNFEDYDRHVFEVAGPECADAMRKVVKMAEDSLSDPAKLTAIKKAFAAEVIVDQDDFLYLIADVGASAVQYGMRDEFCASLTADADTLTAYGNFARRVYEMWGVDALGFSVQSAENLDPNAYLSGFGYRQWMYQSCIQFGFFQNAYHDPAYSVRSPRINPTYHRNLCKRLFGLDQPVDIDGTNRTYYAPILKGASQVLLTNGSQDPWSLLGITANNGNDTNPDLTVLMIDGAAHCDDLRAEKPTESTSVKGVKAKFTELATRWLGQ